MYHKITIVGNLGRDPELRYTDDGTPVCDFSVATNRRWHRPDGSQGEETVWFRITAWRRMAEVCNQYLQKGKQVLVEGQLKPDGNGGPRVWTGNDGEARASYEVTALTVKFLGGRGGATGPNGEGEPESSAELSEEEIPF